jgi:hypothetical protein
MLFLFLSSSAVHFCIQLQSSFCSMEIFFLQIQLCSMGMIDPTRTYLLVLYQVLQNKRKTVMMITLYTARKIS